MQGVASLLDHAKQKPQAILLHRHLAQKRGCPGLLQDNAPNRFQLPGCQAVLQADTLTGKGSQQARLRLKRLFCLAQRDKGQDEGKMYGLFHVQLQTVDEQHVPSQANF